MFYSTFADDLIRPVYAGNVERYNIFKNVNVTKDKEKLRNCSRLKMTKERCPTSLVGPVVKTPSSHYRGQGFDPWLGNLRFRMLRGADKKKKKRERERDIS